MTINISAVPAKNRGLTVALVYCTFQGYNSMTHYMQRGIEEFEKSLPNLYSISIAKNSKGKKDIVAGLVIKTSYTHQDAEFMDAIRLAIKASDKIKHLLDEDNISFLPARLASEDANCQEEALVYVMYQQFVKHSTAWQA